MIVEFEELLVAVARKTLSGHFALEPNDDLDKPGNKEHSRAGKGVDWDWPAE